jgi:hypothetical protein
MAFQQGKSGGQRRAKSRRGGGGSRVHRREEETFLVRSHCRDDNGEGGKRFLF